VKIQSTNYSNIPILFDCTILYKSMEPVSALF
jgi:hypothetical protein